MCMDETRIRVLVANNPFVTRTALHLALAADPRFEALLVDTSVDAVDLTENEMLIVSDEVLAPKGTVIRLTEEPTSVSLTVNGQTRLAPFEGVASLIELLCAVHGEQIDPRGPPRTFRDPPEAERDSPEEVTGSG
jgi:hypothetical protein